MELDTISLNVQIREKSDMFRKLKKGMALLLVVAMIFGFTPCMSTKASQQQ